MCQAFSCIVDKDKKVYWKLAMNSHNKIIDMSPYKDRDDCKKFVRIEITPDNNNYIFPDNWSLRIDSATRPRWFSPEHENACFISLGEWICELDKHLIRKPMIHPFNDVKPPKQITKKIKLLLKEWDSVRGSVWGSVKDSVWDSVGGSVWNSVRGSVRGSVWGSVWGSVRGSVRDSVGGSIRGSVRSSVRGSVRAYLGSFFRLDKWKYLEHRKGVYPYESVVKLWEMGLVPSFDGKVWRLHGGKEAKVLFEISKKDLERYGG